MERCCFIINAIVFNSDVYHVCCIRDKCKTILFTVSISGYVLCYNVYKYNIIMVSNYRLKGSSLVLLFFFYVHMLLSQSFSYMEIMTPTDSIYSYTNGSVKYNERRLEIRQGNDVYTHKIIASTLHNDCIYGSLQGGKLFFLYCTSYIAIINRDSFIIYYFDKTYKI